MHLSRVQGRGRKHGAKVYNYGSKMGYPAHPVWAGAEMVQINKLVVLKAKLSNAIRY